MKRLLVILSVLGLPAANTFAATPSLQQALEQCRTEQNALKRLVCYDEIGTAAAATTTAVQSVPATQTVTQTQQAAAATVAASTATAADKFGLEHRKQANEDTADKVYMTVKSISHTPHKSLIIEFDNGQRWRQNGTDYYKIAVGEQHYIERGVLNSFLLGNDGNNRSIRVRREQ